MAPLTQIAKFSVIPIAYSKSATHYLYARAHLDTKESASPSLPADRTLFLVNVPPDATEREIIMFFKHGGTVERVIFDFDVSEDNNDVEDSEDEEMDDGEVPEDGNTKKRRKGAKEAAPTLIPIPTKPLRRLHKTGRSAHVVFLDSSSLQRALASTSKPRNWPTSPEEPSGLGHYQALYSAQRPSLDTIKIFSDSAVAVYEYEQAKKKQQSKYRKGEAIVDDDGFTLVTRGGAYGKTLGGGVAVATKRFQRGSESKRNRGQKKETTEKEGFYAFQRAEKQRSGSCFCFFVLYCLLILFVELLELKRKWEEDKAKVEKLKAARRFRPY